MFKDEVTDAPLTESQRVAAAVRQVRDQLRQDMKAALEEVIQERETKHKRMLQKIFASILGIVKDPEL